jgi:hypothetical protein
MLFDIRRESVDTRGISEYLIWAKELIEIFPNIIIFHNGSVDVSPLKLPSINLIQVDLDHLSINQRKDEIEWLQVALENPIYKCKNMV